MAKTVFDVLNDKLQEQVRSCEESLVAGSAKDYANYREVVGLLRGLEVSKQFVEDLSRNFMDDDDD